MPDTFWMFLTEGLLCRKIRLGGCRVALQLKCKFLLKSCSMCKRDNMGPSVVDTLEDLRNIQQSLWEVSPAGSACSIKHCWFFKQVWSVCALLFLQHRKPRYIYISNMWNRALF